MMLADRVAVVTGAGQGLGRAEAVALAEAGAAVVVNDVGPAAHEAAEAIVAAGGQAMAHVGDISATAVAAELVGMAVERFGGLDVVVNNAGIVRDRIVFKMSDDEWDDVVRVHLRGHFATTRCATEHWRDRAKGGDRRDAAIVNTASEAFLNTPAGQPNYAAAKAGIVALTLATAKGCAAYGVRANAVCPRAATPMTAPVLAGRDAVDVERLSPDHVAALVVYLASTAATEVTGNVFVAYGSRVGVLAPPTLAVTLDAEGGRWTPEALAEQLPRAVATDGLHLGFAGDEVVAAGADLWGATSEQQRAEGSPGR